MKKKSFTLIELLVVIAIIGLLVIIIAIPINRARRGASIARTLQYEASLHRYLGSDIVGWWKLDGDLTDISGNNNHGTWKGTSDPVPSEKWVDGVPGKEGYALEFDGSSDYVTTSFEYADIADIGTLSFWFNSASIASGELLASHHPAGFIIRYISDKIAVYPRSSNVWNWDFPFSINQWYNLSLTINKNGENKWDYELFINGNSLGVKQVNESITHYFLYIGSRMGTMNFFNGKIDDVRIYSRALTSEEIQTIYTETKNKYITEEL